VRVRAMIESGTLADKTLALRGGDSIES